MGYNPGIDELHELADTFINNAANTEVLAYDASIQKWKNAGSATAADATTTTKGTVQLAGDLAGTAAAPTVPGLASKQPLDSGLTALAALAPADDDVIQRKAGAWTTRTMAQLRSDLGVQAGAFNGIAKTVAAFDAPSDVKAGADYVCDGTNDHIKIQMAIDAVASSTTGGGTVKLLQGGSYHIASTISLSHPTDDGTYRLHLEFERGAKMTWSGVTGTTPMIKIESSDCMVSYAQLSGSGVKGNGYGVVFGGDVANFGGRYNKTVYRSQVAYPIIANLSAGIVFGIDTAGSNSSGDNTVWHPYVRQCKDGILNHGFINRVYGGVLASNDYNVRGGTLRSSQAITLSDMTLNGWRLGCIYLPRGKGSVIRDCDMEHGDTTPGEAVAAVILGHTDYDPIMNTTIEGTLWANLAGEQYAIQAINTTGTTIQDLQMSTAADVPSVAILRQEATNTGRVKVNKVSWASSDTPDTYTHAKLVSDAPGSTGKIVVHAAPDLVGSPHGSTIGPINVDPAADFTVSCSQWGTYFAADRDGHIAYAFHDVGGFPASYVPGVIPTGSNLTAGSTTTGGLHDVLTAVTASNRSIKFAPGVFDLGFNLKWTIPNNITNVKIDGSGIDRTYLINWTTGGNDYEPVSFGGVTDSHIGGVGFTVSAGGDASGGSQVSGDSCDAVDFDSAVRTLCERVKVISSRDRAFVVDGGNTADTTNLASAYDMTFRDCIASGTRPAAPTGGVGPTATGTGTLPSYAYTYRVTQIDPYLRESASLLVGTVTPNGSQRVRITRPTLAAGSRGWRIYRASTTGTADAFWHVATIFSSSVSTWDDNLADDTTGILFDTTGANFIVEKTPLRTSTMQHGFVSLAGQRITLDRCKVYDTADTAFYAYPKNNGPDTAYVRPDHFTVLNCVSRGTQGPAVKINAGFHTKVLGGSFGNCGTPSALGAEMKSTGYTQNFAAISLGRSTANTFSENIGATIRDATFYDDRAAPKTLPLTLPVTNGGATGFTIERNKFVGMASTSLTEALGASSGALIRDNEGLSSEISSSATTLAATATHRNVYLSAGTCTYTLPSAAARGGRMITVIATNAAPAITVAPSGSETIHGAATITAQYGTRTYVSDGVSNWQLAGTETVSSGGGGGGGTASIRAIKTADETVVSSASLQDDDHLGISLAAGTYTLTGLLLYEAPATGDLSVTWDAPSDAIGSVVFLGLTSSATVASGTLLTSPVAKGTSSTKGGIGPGSTVSADVRGYVTIVTPGTFRIRWAQAVADATGTVMKTGSWISGTAV